MTMKEQRIFIFKLRLIWHYPLPLNRKNVHSLSTSESWKSRCCLENGANGYLVGIKWSTPNVMHFDMIPTSVKGGYLNSNTGESFRITPGLANLVIHHQRNLLNHAYLGMQKALWVPKCLARDRIPRYCNTLRNSRSLEADRKGSFDLLRVTGASLFIY